MNDWQGNKIKDGDTIIVIRINQHYPGFGMLSPSCKPPNQHLSDPSDESTWEPIAKFKIEVIGDKLGFRITIHDGEYTINSCHYLNAPAWMWLDEKNCIVAIEGKSDDIETYNLHKN